MAKKRKAKSGLTEKNARKKSPRSKAAKRKIRTVMREFERGELTSSSGEKVTSRDQAVAIALSEARKLERSRK